MDTITGRVTANAVVRTTKSGKKVVGFNLAINESYVSKGDKKQIIKFYECSFWRNEAIAMYLTKGALLELYGSTDARAYLSNGEPKASLTFRIEKVIFHGKGIPQTAFAMGREVEAVSNLTPSSSFDTIPVPEDDLPF